MLLFSFGCTIDIDRIAILSDGVKVSFLQHGTGAPAIVFVHGWGNNTSVWDAQISHFSQKYRVIAVDLPGFGESGTNRTDWTMASFGKVRVPITSINSDTESTNVEAFNKYIPSYRLKIIPDTAHLVMWDNPEEFNRLLEESIQEFINKSK